MNAYRCDLCGELFVSRGEVRVGSIAEMYYTLLKRSDNEVIDICNTCRCRLQDVFDTIYDERLKKENSGYEL